MEINNDPYEQKLLSMFNSFDFNNSGYLNETSLKKLCNSLELKNNGIKLINSLTQNKSSTKNLNGVNFKEFKEALLAFLGTEMEQLTVGTSSLSSTAINIINEDGNIILEDDEEQPSSEKILVISDEEKFLHDCVSPRREVSPKLVKGVKKYGRRSRPQSVVSDSSSCSDSDDPNKIAVVPNVKQQQKVQRSSSQNDVKYLNTNQKSKRRPQSAGNNNNNGTKLKRCASLPAQRKQQNEQKDQFLINHQKLQFDDKNQKASSAESLGNIDFENLSHTIQGIWQKLSESINGRQLLNRSELEILCKRIGLFTNVAEKLSDEIFEKLNLNIDKDRISYQQFINLINGAGGDIPSPLPPPSSLPTNINITDNELLRRNSFCGFSNNYNNLILNFNDTQDSLTTLMDTTSTIRGSATIYGNKETPIQLETLSGINLLEMWENVQITDAKGFLNNLGYDEEDNDINISHLKQILDEELRGIQGHETQVILLKASLALQKTEVNLLQQSYRQLYDENKKLYADNKDVNRRAALLAQEVDERHANLEDSTKTEIRLLEQKHSEIIRELTEQMAADRENWSNLNIKLECRIKLLESEEQKFKLDVNSIQEENSALEKEQISLQKQITDLLETNIKLNNEIVDIEDKQRKDSDYCTKDTEEVLELIEKITTLQIENTNLRDKNDEITAELESVNLELQKFKLRKNKSNNTIDTSSEILSDDPEHSSSGIKRRGDSPSKAKLTEESPRTGKLRKCHTDGHNSESETSGDWVALNCELNSTQMNQPVTTITTTTTTSGFSQDFSSISMESKDEEIKILKEKIQQLEKQLRNGQIKIDIKEDSKPNENEERCKELEASLDQMRRAYEDCEDYWQTKLNDERIMFEKERQIYEDEQRESDKKFTELMEKVQEYEEQFAAKDGRLSPIDEKDALEQQYNDLEQEIEETREQARSMFDEKTKEIESLRMHVQELKMRLGDSVDVIDVCLKQTESAASSPISYLWSQSTIQAPARDYQNPNWNIKQTVTANGIENLSTTETTIFSTAQNNSKHTSSDAIGNSESVSSPPTDGTMPPTTSFNSSTNQLNPIRKPVGNKSKLSSSDPTDDINGQDETSSNSSSGGKSFETHSIASTHSVHKSSVPEISTCSSPNGIKDELKRLKFFEVQLREQIKDLGLKRDSLVMELQQLQEAKPVLEKAYARAAHPTLIQRVNLLEQKNRHLQTVLRQQQQYTETIMQQSWQQQRGEMTELRNRLETQNIILAEQSQRLANGDMLVKDLYVENSHLSATIQRLEQQRSRANLMHQQQNLNNVLPGMP